MIETIDGKSPKVAQSTFVAPNATLLGDIEIGEGSGVWFGAVVRADANHIRIGSRTNIQDLCVLHVDSDNALVVGDDVTVGHRATLHGCRIASRVLIGMGATIMNGAKVGEDTIIGAGALVTEGTEIPPRSLAIGFPAKVKRELTDDEIGMIRKSAQGYAENAKKYLETGMME